ncbi:polymer-forming cytoskeletal protein [Paenibacillus lautus]|uniref:polymer-forming cytoskeletal protein n=1 Tax=Paenibacillus lautus TaxID=1401 RepID=UPI002FBD4572
MIPHDDKLSDLKITGTGSSSGGQYGKVRIDGAGQVNGDLDCRELTGNGTMSLNGDVAADTIRVNGSGTIKGNVDAEELHVAGSLSVKRGVRSRSIFIGGHCSIHGDSESKRLDVTGNLRSHGDVRSEAAAFHGGFKIDGRLHVGTADIRLLGRCLAQEIVGDRITIRKKGKRLWEMLSLPLRGTRLEARIIEGDVLDLEYVEADVVRGNRVILGPGCEIRQVEYRDELTQHPEAQVRASRRF